MRSFLTVLKFELKTLLSKKSFITVTLIFVSLTFIILSIPNYSSIFEGLMKSDKKGKVLMVYDQQGVLSNKEGVNKSFDNYTVTFVDSVETIETSLKNKKAEAGFVVENDTKFVYFVNNSSMMDANPEIFKKLMSNQYQQKALQEKGYDVNEITNIYRTPISSTMNILGTNTKNNFFYTYALIVILFMMIMLYGSQIGVGVASEKSNRAIEILTTSSSSNALIFGKVLAGAVAGILQTTAVIGSALVAYKLNAPAWGNQLDEYFNIPTEVLIIFATFGILGYLLYSFLFGAIGALVSKTEDVNTATSPIQILLAISYVLAFMTMSMPDSLLAKIVSFVPFTSSICMFVNVALGSVSMLELTISFLILLMTTIAVGCIGAKLYRRGTMSYGNAAKFRNIIKMIKQKE